MKKSKFLKRLVAPVFILALVFSLSLPALAADVSLTTALSDIRGTIAVVQANLRNQDIREEALRTLVTQLYTLERSAKAEGVTEDVTDVLTEVEYTTLGMNTHGAKDVKVALGAVRASLMTSSTSSYTVQNIKVKQKSFI